MTILSATRRNTQERRNTTRTGTTRKRGKNPRLEHSQHRAERSKASAGLEQSTKVSHWIGAIDSKRIVFDRVYPPFSLSLSLSLSLCCISVAPLPTQGAFLLMVVCGEQRKRHNPHRERHASTHTHTPIESRQLVRACKTQSSSSV